MSSKNSDVKIVDFGLSKIIGPNEKCDEPFGTLSYCAPEILQQKEYGKPVDIWSLGVVTFLMLVGFLPFDDDNQKEILEPPSIKTKITSKQWNSWKWQIKNSITNIDDFNKTFINVKEYFKI